MHDASSWIYADMSWYCNVVRRIHEIHGIQLQDDCSSIWRSIDSKRNHENDNVQINIFFPFFLYILII